MWKGFNPFTAPAACKQYIYSGLITAAMRFDKNLFTRQREKEDIKAYEFQLSYFNLSFSRDTMAMMELNEKGRRHEEERG